MQAYTTRKREALAPYRLLCSFIGTSLCQRSAIATKKLQCLRLDPFQSDTFVGNALNETQERLPPVKKDLLLFQVIATSFPRTTFYRRF